MVLDGLAIVLTDTEDTAIAVKANGTKQRSLEEPSSEPVIRGPRDGFIENINTNLGLLRNRLKTPRLKTESFTLGELTAFLIQALKNSLRICHIPLSLRCTVQNGLTS
jgi:spore germination protein